MVNRGRVLIGKEWGKWVGIRYWGTEKGAHEMAERENGNQCGRHHWDEPETWE